MRVYSIEQQHHALRIASSRELNDTESRALIRGVEAYRDAEKELDQLRAELARVIKDGHAISTENGRLERELNAARAETARLKGRLERAAHHIKKAQKHCGPVASVMCGSALLALTPDPEPTT